MKDRKWLKRHRIISLVLLVATIGMLFLNLGLLIAQHRPISLLGVASACFGIWLCFKMRSNLDAIEEDIQNMERYQSTWRT